MQASPLAPTPCLAAAASAPPAAHSLSGAAQRWLQWQALAEDLSPLLHKPSASSCFVDDMNRCAEQLMSLTQADPDVAIFHMVHATDDKVKRYGVLHAMHTAMLMTLIGHRKDWGPARTASAVKAALTMNIAITALQVELAQQATPLSDAQRQAIQAHPLAACQQLRELGVTDPEWLSAVAQHHEQADGKGYPLGLTQVHPLADALHTCDIFGAKMSPRTGRSGLPTPRAASEIFRQRSVGYFGATIIRELGLYPPGCRVTLHSGEHAVVVRRTRDPHAPMVVVLRGHAGPLPEPQLSPTTVGQGRHIVGVAPDPAEDELVTPVSILSLS